jgi:predicted NUDIX family NTP pyrophosphohydrolase
MAKRSAGILIYRRGQRGLELLLVHPGGPFWKKRDIGAWSIPKGEYLAGEDPITVAMREFEEETGARPTGDLQPLGEVVQKGGKIVAAWAVESDLDPAKIKSNTFEIEWPPKSGRKATFPEIDQAAWFSPDEARAKILPSQKPFIERLVEIYGP